MHDSGTVKRMILRAKALILWHSVTDANAVCAGMVRTVLKRQRYTL
mgnify:CR=1 FL=1